MSLSNAISPWPVYSAEEIDAVSNVLMSGNVNFWTGSECKNFEREFALFVESKFAIALANGTVALETALVALGLGSGDEVIVTSRTFIASVASILSVGAIPVFADVEVCSQNISARTVEKALSSRTRAIICVHLNGWPCDMDPIMALARKHELFVIEDCAQAHGARYRGQSVGSIGHVGAWSFCQDKIITTGGEGGMVTCNDEAIWRAMWSYKDHGKSYAAVFEREHPPGFRWVHESFGSNGRMTEMQAAIGRIQLRRINDWTVARTSNAHAIRQAILPFAGRDGIVRVPELRCEGCPLLQGEHCCSCVHAYYKFYAFLRPERLSDEWSRDMIVEEFNNRGVPCYTGSCSEVYLEKAFDTTNFRPKDRLPVAKELGETSLLFLIHPTLTTAEVKTFCTVIYEVFTKIFISVNEDSKSLKMRNYRSDI